jgi:hypothetical protein
MNLARSMGFSMEQIIYDVKRFGQHNYAKALTKAARFCSALDPATFRRSKAIATLLDVAFTTAINTQGYTFEVRPNGSRSCLDLLMVYNGTLACPKIERTINGKTAFAKIIGSGVILSPNTSASFGIEAPVTDSFSEWRPCLFEGDLERRRRTPIVAVANDIGVDVRVIKSACNEAIHRAAQRNRPGWVLHRIAPGSILEDVLSAPDVVAKKRLAFHYLAFAYPEEYALLCEEWGEKITNVKPPEPEVTADGPSE